MFFIKIIYMTPRYTRTKHVGEIATMSYTITLASTVQLMSTLWTIYLAMQSISSEQKLRRNSGINGSGRQDIRVTIQAHTCLVIIIMLRGSCVSDVSANVQ